MFLVWKPPQFIRKVDASTEGWGACCHDERTGCTLSGEERKLHINVLELKAAKFVVLAFTQKERFEQHPH